MLDFLDKKSIIANDTDLNNMVNDVINGDIKSYCDLKDYFLLRFPLINSDIKTHHKKLAFNTFQNAADSINNPYSQSFIGWLYWTGLCGDINDSLAIEYFSKAAKQQNAIGLTELGLVNTIIGINNKPDIYTALNLFEDASHRSEATGYIDMILGLYEELYKGDYNITIHYLKKALAKEIGAAASELANIYLLKGSQDDSYELYASTPYHFISAFNLALFFYGDRAKCTINEDQVKAFQCFLVAKATGYPLADWYLSFYKNSPVAKTGNLFTKIEKHFMESVSFKESSNDPNFSTPNDIFKTMKDDFEELYSQKINRGSLGIEFSIDHYVDYCYNHCLLSSILVKNLQLSISEKLSYSIINSQFNKIFLEALNK